MEVEMSDLANNLTSFADGLGKLFGKNCEVAIFKCKDLKHEHVFTNNNLTGRKHGEALNHYELEAFNKAQVHNGYTIFSYTTSEGRSIKSALFIIEDSLEKEYMTIIISFDMTDFLLASKILQSFCVVDQTTINKSIEGTESVENIDCLMKRLVSDAINKIGKPISYLSKEEKVKIVRILNEKGVFLIKGSIEYVAETLCVSRYTIYNYLEEIR